MNVINQGIEVWPQGDTGIKVSPQGDTGIKVSPQGDTAKQLSPQVNWGSNFVQLAEALTPIAADDSLRSRVMASLTPRPKNLLHTEEGEFVRVLAGVYVKQLRADAKTETGLWRLEPGAVIPPHGHQHEEECLVVSGSIRYAGRTLFSGDFLGAAKDEYQGEIISTTGALLLIRSELRGSNSVAC